MSSHQLSPPIENSKHAKGVLPGMTKRHLFLRRVKSMWAHRLLRKAYCEFSGEGCVCCLFLQEKNGAKVSYQTLSIINRHTHPPSLTHRSPGCMRSDEDGVHAGSGAASVVFSNTQLELAASGIQIFRKTAANLEAVPEYARGTPHCEPYRQKYKRKSSSPLSEAGCCSTLLLGLDAVLDSLSNRSYWRP